MDDIGGELAAVGRGTWSGHDPGGVEDPYALERPERRDNLFGRSLRRHAHEFRESALRSEVYQRTSFTI